MRFDTQQHQFYGGIDLHARSMYLCILNQDGEILEHRAPEYEGGTRTISESHGPLSGGSRRLRRMPLHRGPGSPTSAPGKVLPSSWATRST
jgi:hypothetical protein